jgi:DNA-binding transcriptional MerR regulator
MRVEDLARQAGASVDTIRYYQKQRLLPPPERDGRLAWYTGEHLDRIARIRELQRRGFTLAVIRRFVSGELAPADEPLAAAVAGEVYEGEADEELFGLDELAARAQVPAPLLESLVREGLLVARVHAREPRFSAADVELLGNGLRLLEAGLPMPELLELARHHHEVTREVAGRAVKLFDEYVRGPLRDDASLSEEQRAERMIEAFRVLLPAVTSLVAHHFRRILLQVAQEHLESVGEPVEIEAARTEGERRLEPVPSGAVLG